MTFDQLIKEGVVGDIAELGTYKGHTATILAIMARRMETTAWILDTFEGFSPQDLQGIDAAKHIEFNDTSLEAVRARVGENNVRYVKGYFPETAEQIPNDRAFCLVHIDCDLYAPIRAALEYFYPRLLPGGYIIVHDYGSLDWDGAEKAVDEFFAERPEVPIPLTDGGGSVVIRRMRPPGHTENWITRRQRGLLSTEYVSAARGQLCPLLIDGWSSPEAWGIWGVGTAHVIRLVVASMPEDGLIVEFDVSGALVGQIHERTFDVWAVDRHLATWTFSQEANRARRRVIVPADIAAADASGFAVIELSIRPQLVARIIDLDPTSTEERALGIALLGMRRLV